MIPKLPFDVIGTEDAAKVEGEFLEEEVLQLFKASVEKRP